MQAFRSVCAEAVRYGRKVEAVDLTSAYINADWPASPAGAVDEACPLPRVPRHFIQLTKAQWQYVPEELREEAVQAHNRSKQGAGSHCGGAASTDDQQPPLLELCPRAPRAAAVGVEGTPPS